MALTHMEIEQIVGLLDQAVGAMGQVSTCVTTAEALIAQDAPNFHFFTESQFIAFDEALSLIQAKRDFLRAKTVSISDIGVP
jgi:hypothetical protein